MMICVAGILGVEPMPVPETRVSAVDMPGLFEFYDPINNIIVVDPDPTGHMFAHGMVHALQLHHGQVGVTRSGVPVYDPRVHEDPARHAGYICG